MATTVAHASLIRYDDNGNQLVINLKNTGDDVSIVRSANGNLPSNVTSAQSLANALGALAFKSSLSKSDIGLGNVDNTSDVNKSVKYATSAGSANAVAWGNVSGKPSTYPPSAHNHCVMNTIGDYRSKNTKPCDYNEQIVFQGLKGSGTINLVGPTYSYLVGLRGWLDISGGQSHEIAFNDYGIYTRKGTSETTWDTWRKFLTTAIGANGIYVGKETPTEECVWVKMD